MGAARRKSEKSLGPKKRKSKQSKSGPSPRIISWFPVTQDQRNQFIQLTIRGSWAGIACLVFLWLIVRIIGPTAGWWIPADIK